MLHTPYQNSMVWFEGVVESRQDPLKLSRVQVRVFGIHTDNLAQIPTKDLHWMQVMHPTTSSANSGVSETPKLIEGTHVIGYFRDGDMRQDGIVLGSIAGIPQAARVVTKGFNDQRTNLAPTVVPGRPSNLTYVNGTGVVVTNSNRPAYPSRLDEPDTSRLARNYNASVGTVLEAKKKSQETQKNIPIAGGGTFSEPTPPYAAVYPYNDVKETESGHTIELDDTPGKERVHIAHRTGSFVEMHPDGSVVHKAAKNDYNIVHANSYEHIEGEKVVTIDKGAKLFINSESGGAGLVVQVGAGGDLVIKIDAGNLNIEVNGDMTTTCTGAYTVIADTINLN